MPKWKSIEIDDLSDFMVAEIFKKNTKVIWLHGIKNWFNLIIIILGKLKNKKIFVRDELNFHKKRSFLNKLLNKKFFFILDNFIDCYLSIGKKNKQAYLLNGIKRNKIFDMPYTVDNSFFKKKHIKNCVYNQPDNSIYNQSDNSIYTDDPFKL